MPAAKQEISPEIRAFLEDLLEEGDVILPDPILHEEAIQKLVERLDKFLSICFAQHLSDTDMQAFVRLNEQGKSLQEINQFLKEKIPQVDIVIKDAFAEFRLLYLGNTKKGE